MALIDAGLALPAPGLEQQRLAPLPGRRRRAARGRRTRGRLVHAARPAPRDLRAVDQRQPLVGSELRRRLRGRARRAHRGRGLAPGPDPGRARAQPRPVLSSSPNSSSSCATVCRARGGGSRSCRPPRRRRSSRAGRRRRRTAPGSTPSRFAREQVDLRLRLVHADLGRDHRGVEELGEQRAVVDAEVLQEFETRPVLTPPARGRAHGVDHRLARAHAGEHAVDQVRRRRRARERRRSGCSNSRSVSSPVSRPRRSAPAPRGSSRNRSLDRVSGSRPSSLAEGGEAVPDRASSARRRSRRAEPHVIARPARIGLAAHGRPTAIDAAERRGLVRGSTSPGSSRR